MKQYKHTEFEFKPKQETDRIAVLEEQVKTLIQQVQELKQTNAFLMRQDQRTRSNIDTIRQRHSK